MKCQNNSCTNVLPENSNRSFCTEQCIVYEEGKPFFSVAKGFLNQRLDAMGIKNLEDLENQIYELKNHRQEIAIELGCFDPLNEEEIALFNKETTLAPVVLAYFKRTGVKLGLAQKVAAKYKKEYKKD